MSNKTKTVRILERVGDPSRGVILQPGAVVELPAVWADRYLGQGAAEPVEKPPKAEPKPKKKK